MKVNLTKFATVALSLFCAVGLFSTSAFAQTGGSKTFVGNGSTAWGGPIGTASLQITDDTTNIYGSLTINEGSTGGNVLVIYIQSGTNGGFTNTAGFGDYNDDNRKAISGYDPSNGRSVFNFYPGFTPQYALGIDLGSFAGIWGLTNGGTNSLPFIGSLGLNPSSGSGAGTYTFSFPLSAIGLPSGPSVVGKTITLGGTFISASAFRSPEDICGNTDGTSGWNPTAETATASYLIGEQPATTYPVTFQVDMTAMMQAGEFNPANGDQVEVKGSFNANADGLYLSPESNTNIYSVTYQATDALGTPETFSYTIFPQAGGNIPESTDTRTFVLTNSQTLPVWYFSSYAPSTNATVPLTFSVNMGVQIAGGNFDPANDSVYVFGDMNENSALSWGTGAAAMTQSLTNTNVYVGTYGDGNYAGTPCQYKFVRYSSALSQDIYESRPNRQYITPATSNAFPTVYFNDETNVTVVTFTVDMAAQMAFGHFNPANDTIAVGGSYNGGNWGVGTVCTNVAGTTNLFSCSIDIYDAPGTTEQYKFIAYGADYSGTDYESPASTGGNNRTYILPSSSTNMPIVAFSDQYISDLLLQPVTVVFSVAMTNNSGPVVGTDSTVWSPSVGVYINGDSIANWAPWDTSLPQLYEGPNSSAIYTWTNTFAAGSPVIVNYKYSMNGNDDEAGFAQNHTRYIRSYGTYNMPLDVFGSQTQGPSYGVEQSFGNLKASAPVGNTVPITWLGRPGVHLQVATSPTGPWTDHPETDAMSATNYPMSGSAMYFRLVHPEQ